MKDLRQIRKGNLYDVDGGIMQRMRVERFYIDENDKDCVIISTTKELRKRTCACPVELLDGIPVSEELIQGLGFEWDKVTAMWYYDGMGIIENGEQGFSLIPTPRDYLLAIPIPYLHTLQNVYYHLTGKELPVKTYHFDEEE